MNKLLENNKVTAKKYRGEVTIKTELPIDYFIDEMEMFDNQLDKYKLEPLKSS